MKKIILCSFPLFMLACSNKDEKPKSVDVPQSALTQSANSEAFNKSFSILLSNYYALKDAFIKEDTVNIAANAKALMIACDSLKLGELKADAAIVETAKMNNQNLKDELKGLQGEAGLLNKRKSFQMATSDMYDLLRVVKYDQAIVYMQHCPMAFENRGADWLSNTSDVANPYIPGMDGCVEVKDSVDYRIKK